MGFQEEPRIQPADLDNFLCFLTLNQKEKDELVTPMVKEMNPIIKEMRIKKNEYDLYHERGLNFPEVLTILNKVDFFGQFELTEKERMSVLSTQIIKEILSTAKLISDAPEFKTSVEDASDVFNRFHPFDGPSYEQPKILIARASKN